MPAPHDFPARFTRPGRPLVCATNKRENAAAGAAFAHGRQLPGRELFSCVRFEGIPQPRGRPEALVPTIDLLVSARIALPWPKVKFQPARRSRDWPCGSRRRQPESETVVRPESTPARPVGSGN